MGADGWDCLRCKSHRPITDIRGLRFAINKDLQEPVQGPLTHQVEKFSGRDCVAGGECMMSTLEAGFKVHVDFCLCMWVDDSTLYLNRVTKE